jgi:hypothetical protein
LTISYILLEPEERRARSDRPVCKVPVGYLRGGEDV